MDTSSVQNDQHDELVILSVINTWFAAFQLWDFLVCCPEEIRRLYVPEARRFWNRRIPPSLGTILLFNARILTLPITVLCIYAQLDPASCRASYLAWWTLIAIAHINCAAIFAVRTIAIWTQSRAVSVVLWLGVAAVAGANLWWPQVFRMEKLRDDDGSSHGCYSATNPPQLVFRLPNGIALVYDSMVLILTVAKIIHTSQIQGFSPKAFRQTRRSASPLSRQLYNSAIFFYILSIISYAGGLAWASFHSQNRSTSVFAGLQFLVSVTIAPRILRRLKLLDRSALGLEPAKAESKPIRLSRRSPSQWSDVDLNFQTSFAKPDPIQAPQQAVSPRIQSEVLVRSPSMGFRRELTENHQQTPLQTVRVELYTPPSTSDSQRGAWRRHSEDSEARLMP